MAEISDYFSIFPEQDDPNFTAAVSAKQEFRELSHYGYTNGLFNNQELVVRMMSPGTGVRCIMLNSYMGTGKTRTGLKIAEKWRGIMRNKPLLISPGDSIQEVHTQEIRTIYNNPDMSTTEINRLYEMQHYISFNNLLSNLMNIGAIDQIKRDYGHRVIFADEIHYLRAVEQDKTTNKVFNDFFHLVMDTAIIVLATGTITVDNAAEINIMNLILPLDKQMEKAEVIAETSNASSEEMLMPYMSKYLPGYLMYFNQDVTTLPPITYLGERIESDVGGNVMLSDQPVITHNIGGIQRIVYFNELAMLQGGDKSTFSTHILYALNFIFGGWDDKPYDFNAHAEDFLSDSSTNSIGRFRDPQFSESMRDLNIVREYGAKYADTIQNILDEPQIMRYVYISWVRMGVVIFGILLELQGFRYYNAMTPLTVDSRPMKRYAIITERTTKKQLTNILHAANMIENKYGDYLKVVIGSPKSSIGISLINARQVDIMQADWHRGGTSQVISRIIRNNSLKFFDKNNADEYFLRIAQHAAWTISDIPDFTDRFTKDVEMIFLSDLKARQVMYTEQCEANLCINTALSSYRNKNIPDPMYERLETDYSSYIANGYSTGYEEQILYEVKEVFAYTFSVHLDEIEALFPSHPPILVTSVLNSVVTYNTLLRDRWGRECFLRYADKRDTYYLQHDTVIGNEWTYSNSREAVTDTRDIYYHKNTSLFEFIREPLLEAFIQFAQENEDVSRDELMERYLNLNIESKIVSLEAILVDRNLINRRVRKRILRFMDNSWFVLPNKDCVVHILEQVNIDRVHYTANISKLQGNGKMRIYCFNDPIPQWRFVSAVDEPFILEYVNIARAANEDAFASKSSIYGILNTTDNLFRIKDSTEGESKAGKKKPKGFICMDSKKGTIIRYLYNFNIQPPKELVAENSNVKLSAMRTFVRDHTRPEDLPAVQNEDTIRFYYIWLKANMENDICPSMRDYFSREKLLFIK